MAALRKRPRSQVMDEEDENIKKEFTDFFRFCSFVLAYEEQMGSDTLPNLGGTYFSSAVDGVGSAGGSTHHSSSSDSESDTKEDKDVSEDKVVDDNDNDKNDDGDNDDDDSESSKELLEYTSEDESWHLVTCFCGRPFAGRPMIECSKCLTWIHLFCARIKKQNVPDVYVCQICKDKETRKLKRQK